MAEILVTEADHGREALAKVGDMLVVQLNETPTTGFRWTLGAIDGNILELTSDTFQPGARAAVGGGGRRVFRFAVKGRGKALVALKLIRSWESARPKARLEVRVNAS